MKIIPAIDLFGHQCVRLHQGKYEDITVYSDNPLDQAKMFEQQGATHLHLVDLEAAKSGTLAHLDVLEKIKSSTNLHVDFGGGIRSVISGESVINAGADQINVGTMAVKSPGEFEKLLLEVGTEKVILSADREGSILKTHGWLESAKISFWQFLENFFTLGGRYVTSTDISKDGTLSGVDYEGYQEIWERYPQAKLVVSGGVASEADILMFKNAPVYGVIIGKAIYEKKIDLSDVIKKIATDAR